jgi:hypothetical protein
MQAIANKVSSMRDSMDSHSPLKSRILLELMEELKLESVAQVARQCIDYDSSNIIPLSATDQ